MASLKQIAANRANAKRSTGPRTAQGKARSRLNATRHSLTGQVLVLSSEDLAAYQSHCAAFAEHYQPQTPLERATIQQLADIRWRLDRIAAVEANLFSLTGQQSSFNTGNEQIDRALAQAQALPAQIAALSTLSLYEQRLLRSFDKTLEAFRELQWRRRVHKEPAPPKPAEDRPSDDGSGPAASAPEPAPASEHTERTSPEIGFVSSTAPAKAKTVPARAETSRSGSSTGPESPSVPQVRRP